MPAYDPTSHPRTINRGAAVFSGRIGHFAALMLSLLENKRTDCKAAVLCRNMAIDPITP
jgi:hypothetical protein